MSLYSVFLNSVLFSLEAYLHSLLFTFPHTVQLYIRLSLSLLILPFMPSCTFVTSSPLCPRPFVLVSLLVSFSISATPLSALLSPASHTPHPLPPPPLSHQMKLYNSWENRGRECLLFVSPHKSVHLSSLWGEWTEITQRKI